MADVFVSYARSDKARVAPLVAAIEAQGWSVWWDPEIAAGQEFDRQIATELKSAAAVVVVWTPTSVESRWVRGEARDAADRGVLVPVRFDGSGAADRRARHPHHQSRRLGRESGECRRAGIAALARRDDQPAARAPACRSRRAAADATGRASGYLDLRAAVRQHERRSGAGVFQRRHQRGHHHRPDQGVGARRGVAQHGVQLQGQVGRGRAGCAAAQGQPRARRQRAQGGRPGADHGPADRRARKTTRSGPSATIAT